MFLAISENVIIKIRNVEKTGKRDPLKATIDSYSRNHLFYT